MRRQADHPGGGLGDVLGGQRLGAGIDRFRPLGIAAEADLAEAFRWSEWRTVSKTALVSLHGNRYQVDPALARRRVELVFDPFDLNVLFVRHDGKDAGTATPYQITRHSHPKARPEDPGSGDDAPRATGVDYIALISEQHTRQMEGPVNYHALMPPASGQDGQDPEQDEPGAGGEDGRG